MEKKVLIALVVLVNMVYVCQAQNAVVKMFPENGATNVTPVPYLYKTQHVTNRNTKAGTPSGINAWDTGHYQLDISHKRPGPRHQPATTDGIGRRQW